ncbi:restriction endonuclease subunit S [Lentzea alba]|uniref:restriction endonuclease subunit S n=1 Tax=Lentzea alba TaxID=2714351 RepID=UPI0039BFDA4E
MTSLPAGWTVVPLDSLQASEPRAITDGPFGSNLTSAHYTDRGPRVVRLQNIGDGVFNDAKAHISQDHFETLRNHEVLPNDLLIASLGETLPRGCLAPPSLGAAIVKADCIRVRLSPDVDPRWVMYSLQRPAVRQWAEHHRHGVGRPRLGLKVIRQIPVPLPPLGEQQRLVEILENHISRLDFVRSTCTATIQRLTRLRQAELNAKFGLNDGDTVTLGDLVTGIQAGRSAGGSAPPAQENEWGIVKVSAMTWGEFRPQENKAVPKSLVNPDFEIMPGDLLVSRANTSEYVGAPVLVGEVRRHLLLSDKSLRLQLRAEVDPEWLWRALQAPSARRQISAAATGTKDSMRNISQKSLLSVRLPKAEPDVQRWLAKAYAERDLEIKRIEQAADSGRRRVAALRRAVLTAAYSGTLTDNIEELAGV